MSETSPEALRIYALAMVAAHAELEVEIAGDHGVIGSPLVAEAGKHRAALFAAIERLVRPTPTQKLDALLGDRPVPRVLPEDVQNL